MSDQPRGRGRPPSTRYTNLAVRQALARVIARQGEDFTSRDVTHETFKDPVMAQAAITLMTSFPDERFEAELQLHVTNLVSLELAKLKDHHNRRIWSSVKGTTSTARRWRVEVGLSQETLVELRAREMRVRATKTENIKVLDRFITALDTFPPGTPLRVVYESVLGQREHEE
jgi:hypothetical protein